MTQQQIWKQSAERYRDFPLLDMKFLDVETAKDVKAIFGLLLSRDRLKESIRDHLIPDPNEEHTYSETSPFLATMKTRLLEIEQKLIQFEGKYGKLIS